MARAKPFLVALATFAILDALWIGVLMTEFYRHELGAIARREGEALAPRWGAALCIYVLIPGGLLAFVQPRVEHRPRGAALAWGALFGLVVYGTYDLTNRAVLETWSLRMTLVDIAWGATICALTSLAMHVFSRPRVPR